MMRDGGKQTESGGGNLGTAGGRNRYGVAAKCRSLRRQLKTASTDSYELLYTYTYIYELEYMFIYVRVRSWLGYQPQASEQ